MDPLKKFLVDKGLIIKFMNEEALNSHLRITLGTQEENRMVVDAIKEYFESK
jgi:histidinol-phosphate aminotransferase